MKLEIEVKPAKEMLSSLAKSLEASHKSIQFFFGSPDALRKLFRIETGSTGAQKARLALEPTYRCLNLLAAVRALERETVLIQRAAHRPSPNRKVLSTPKRGQSIRPASQG